MSSDNRYLEQLTYDPELDKSWFTFFTDKYRVVFLLILIFIIAGVVSFRGLPLESTPEVDLGIVSVNAVLP
jgi:multidrug efflux pump subunit AcrB